MFREDRREAREEIICVVKEGNVFLASTGTQGVRVCVCLKVLSLKALFK